MTRYTKEDCAKWLEEHKDEAPPERFTALPSEAQYGMQKKTDNWYSNVVEPKLNYARKHGRGITGGRV